MTTNTVISPAATSSDSSAASESAPSAARQLVHDVAIVVPSSDAAVESSVRSLAEALASRGLAVRVIVPHHRSAAHTSSAGGLVRIDRSSGRGPQWLRRAIIEARHATPDVVHVEWPTASLGAAAVLASSSIAQWARRRRATATGTQPEPAAPLVVALHDVARVNGAADPAMSGGRSAVAALAAARLVAAAVVVEEAACRAVVPESFVIPSGVHRTALPDRSGARRALGLDGRFTVLCVEELRADRGLETVLEAAQLLRGAVQLVVAAPTPLRRADRGYLDALQTLYGDTATFVQPATELDTATCFAACDVVMLSAPGVAGSLGPFARAVGSRRPILVSEALARHMGLAAEMVVPLEPQALAARLHEMTTGEGGDVPLARLAGWTEAVAAERDWARAAAMYHGLYERLAREARARDGEAPA